MKKIVWLTFLFLIILFFLIVSVSAQSVNDSLPINFLSDPSQAFVDYQNSLINYDSGNTDFSNLLSPDLLNPDSSIIVSSSVLDSNGWIGGVIETITPNSISCVGSSPPTNFLVGSELRENQGIYEYCAHHRIIHNPINYSFYLTSAILNTTFFQGIPLNTSIYFNNSGVWSLLDLSVNVLVKSNSSLDLLFLTNKNPEDDLKYLLNVFGAIEDPDLHPTGCRIINQSTTLTQNIVGTKATECFSINASNLYFNCAGYNVTSNPAGLMAFNITPFTVGGVTTKVKNVTIQNCNIFNFTIGINISSVSNIYLFNNNVSNISDGVWLNSTALSVLENNTVSKSLVFPFILFNSSNNTLNRNNGSSATANNGFELAAGSSYNVLYNDTGTSGTGNGIVFLNSNNNQLLNSTGTSAGSTGVGILLSGSSNNNISNSVGISTSSGTGITIQSTSLNNLVFNSTGMASVNGGTGIATKLSASNNNISFSTGIVTTSGTGIFLNSGNNSVENSAGISKGGIGAGIGINIQVGANNVSNSVGIAENKGIGLKVSTASNNVFWNDTFMVNGSSIASVFVLSNSNNNNFTNTSLVGNTGFEINVSNNVLIINSSFQNTTWSIKSNGGNVSLIDNQRMTNYSFVNEPFLMIHSTQNGMIQFFNISNANGTNLSMDVNLSFNRFFVNSTNSKGFNSSNGVLANITVFGLNSVNILVSPQIDLFDNNNFVNCNSPQCVVLSVSSNAFVFNVSSFTTYRVGNFCGLVNESVSLNSNVVQTVASKACFDFNQSNILFDCKGFSIVGNPFGMMAFNVTNAAKFNLSNITIQNCNIMNFSVGINVSSASNISLFNNNVTNSSYGIQLNNTINSLIINDSVNGTVDGIDLFSSYYISINTSVGSGGVSSQGIYLLSSSNNTIFNSTGNSGTSGFGIEINGGSQNNIFNSVGNSAGSGAGIDIISTSNNNVSDSFANGNNAGVGIFLSSSKNISIYNVLASAGDAGEGIEVLTSNNNTISKSVGNASSNGYGLFLFNNGESNTVINNTFITGGGIAAVYFLTNSNHNFFVNNTLVGNTGFEINGSSNNSLINTVFQNTNWSIKTGRASNVSLIDNQRMTNYSFVNVSSLIIKSTNVASVNFFNITQANGTNLSMDVNLSTNFTRVNTTRSLGLNVSANITFFNVAGFTNPQIIVDYADLGSFENCTKCTILTPYANTNNSIIFNVSSFTTYAINETFVPPIMPHIDLINPLNATNFSYSNRPFNFSFNATDDINMTLNCNLLINNTINVSLIGITAGTNFTVQNVNLSRGFEYTWGVNCTDGLLTNQTLFRVFNITNTPPAFIQNMNSANVLQNRTFLRQINATDADNDVITYGSNSTIFSVSATGLINITTDTVLTENDTVSAADAFGGNTTTSFVFQINESRPNIVLTNVIDGQSYLFNDRPFNFSFNATTPPNANSTLNVVLFINSTNNSTITQYNVNSIGSFLVNLSRGFYTLAVQASDGFVTNQTTNLNIQINNTIPMFTQNMTNVSIKIGQQFFRQVNTSDINGDTVFYSNNNTQLFNITSLGVINRTFLDSNIAGTYFMVINVSDGFGGSASSNFTLQINNSDLPIINFSNPINSQIFSEGTNVSFVFTCTDDINTSLNAYLFINNVLNQSFVGISNASLQNISILFVAGNYNAFVNCTDGFNTVVTGLTNFSVVLNPIGGVVVKESFVVSHDKDLSVSFVLLFMAFVFLGLSFLSKENSFVSAFFLVLAMWLLFLNLHFVRVGMGVIDFRNESINYYNVTSNVLFRQENSTQMDSLVLSNSFDVLVSKTSFYWLIMTIIVSLFFVFKFFEELISFFGWNKKY